MRRFILLLCLPLLAGMLTVPIEASNSARSITAQRAPTPTDSQLEATIRMKLAKSKIGKDGFRFHVQRGIVTWEGTTNVMQHKGSATRMARTAGAVQVINKIEVSASGKAKATSNLKKAYVEQ